MGRKISGLVFSDLGRGASFMALAWVQQSVRERLGFSPYPATLNLRLESPEEVAAWREVKQEIAGVDLPPPDPSFCHACCFLVDIEGRQRGAVVVPEVDGYPPNKIEVIAPVRLKDELPARDGDRITIEFKV
ncbi:MAG: CTP-dependent riboflavin kinase [Deltaproteobacteria bacterium]|nr:CTP-dependent riboflavin kinase [Deltaproteobacteria bacterium]